MFFPKKPSLEKFFIFSQKAPNFLETETAKKSLYFRKQNLLILQEMELSYISWDGTFLYCRKRNFLILQETELSYTSENGTFLYFGKGIFRTRDIFRTLPNTYDRTFCKNSYLAHFHVFLEMKLSCLIFQEVTFWTRKAPSSIYDWVLNEFAKLCTFRAVASSVLRALRALCNFVPGALRVFASYVLCTTYVPSRLAHLISAPYLRIFKCDKHSY